MPFYWPTGSTTPTWVTVTTPLPTAGWFGIDNGVTNAITAATTANGYIWQTNSTAGTAGSAYNQGLLSQQLWAANSQQEAADQAYQNYQLSRFGNGLGQIGALAAPALSTHQEQARRDQELYRRALAEHDDQEAGRLLRQIEARELVAADRQRLLEQQMQQQREDRGRREVATDRARELLLEHLTLQQRETFVENGWFVVEGGRTKTKYRIRGGTLVANIDVLDKRDRSTHRLCGHAQSHIPMGDQLLSQKIMLELAEDEFLRLANRHTA